MGGKQVNKVNPERRRQRFTREFKLEAMRLLKLRQKPATQLALELGVQRNRLYKWQAQVKAGRLLHGGPGRPGGRRRANSRDCDGRTRDSKRSATS